jgi:hypothetical protein
MTNLILPEHVARARAKQVKKETKKKEEAKLPEPTGWRTFNFTTSRHR